MLCLVLQKCRRSPLRALLGLFLVAPPAVASIKVTVAGETEKVASFNQEQTEYFSFSELVDILGGKLDWELVGHRISFVEDTSRFIFDVGSPFFKINDSIYNLTFPARLEEGQLFLPADIFIPFLDRVLAQKISYSAKSGSIRIDSEYFNVIDFAVSAKANGLLFEIYLTSALAYDVFVTEGNWVNVSIRGGKLNQSRIRSRQNRRYMYKLKTHQTAETGQVSFRLRRKVENWHHKLAFDPPRIQISIPDMNFELDSADTTPHIGPDNKIDVIIIDPGHGGDHYGAVGPGRTREKDIALKIARELAKLIRKDKEFQVVMTRDRDRTISLEERARIGNDAKGDLFISIHANSSTKRHVRGWNVFFLAQANNDSARAVAQFENSAFLRDQATIGSEESEYDGGIDPVLSILNEMIMTEFQTESHDFAMMVDREFRRNLKIPARGVDQAGFFVLNRVYTPSVLVEAGFISNRSEEKILRKGNFQKDVARSIYDAIKRFKAKYER